MSATRDATRPIAGAPVRTAALIGIAVLASCAIAPDPMRYRLTNSGTHWDVSGDDAVFEDLRDRYPDFFAVILDPSKTHNPSLLQVRDDLERQPVDRRNFDALNAVAMAYFEINYRAESGRGEGFNYLALSQNGAKLLAVPWRAYGETEDATLRGAILDFYEDAVSGQKLGSAPTAGRVVAVVASLERKERDPARIERIRSLVARFTPADAGGDPPF